MGTIGFEMEKLYFFDQIYLRVEILISFVN